MSMCRVFSCVVGRGCSLWPVCSLGKTLLTFALLHSVLQGQTCLLLQVFLSCLLVFKLRAPGPMNIFFLSWILFYWISVFVLLKGIEPISIYLYSKEYCILEILPYLDVPAHFFFGFTESSLQHSGSLLPHEGSLQLQHVRSSSLTRDQTRGPWVGNVVSSTEAAVKSR